MIVKCGNCARLFDAGGLEAGAAVRCECGDILPVPEGEAMEAGPMIKAYVGQLVRDERIVLDELPGGNRWEFQRGSARIEVNFSPAEQSFSVSSTIMPVPADPALRSALCLKVLRLNLASTGEARFAIDGDRLVVTFARAIAGLDYVEFHRALESVSRTADDYDDELRAEFLPAPEETEDGEIDLTKV